jgi:hypothetical protein
MALSGVTVTVFWVFPLSFGGTFGAELLSGPFLFEEDSLSFVIW